MEQQELVRFLTDLPEEKMKSELIHAFTARYGGSEQDIVMVASPARINVIGEHIDYNGGKVFPAAINRYLYVLMRKRPDSPAHMSLILRKRFITKKNINMRII